MPSQGSGQGSNQGNRSVSPAEIQKHLKGTDYPATRDQLVQKARSNQAPQEVIQELQKLPGNQYESPADLMKAFGQTR